METEALGLSKYGVSILDFSKTFPSKFSAYNSFSDELKICSLAFWM